MHCLPSSVVAHHVLAPEELIVCVLSLVGPIGYGCVVTNPHLDDMLQICHNQDINLCTTHHTQAANLCVSYNFFQMSYDHDSLISHHAGSL